MSLYTRGKRGRGSLKKILFNKLMKKNFDVNQFSKLQKILSSQGLILKKNRLQVLISKNLNPYI